MQLNDLLGHYDELLYLPDKTPILAALAIVAAQDIPGPPVWTLLVGPPSSGKTEIIDSLRLVNGAFSVSTLTKASLLSGRTGGAGGLLLTHFRNGHGLLLVKDFTSILSEAAGARTETIAVLREVYDGHITRAVGSRDTPLSWAGQISFLGAVTEEIELHRATIDLMGNRFLYVPMPPTHRAREEIARTAIMQARQQHQTREALAVAVSDFFTQLPPTPSLDLGDDEIDRLVAGATFAALATWVLSRTRVGNWIFGVGGDQVAARNVGVPVRRVKIGLFMATSMCAALVGIMIALRLGSMQASQ